jgi:Rps23 Pro-64 3,4-dihydroxylase Tpa1-like proline 4-hydroxylase
MLHSAAFSFFLAEITGIEALCQTHTLVGPAGYSVMHEGGKAGVHADPNTDMHCGLQRRLAMFVYLNKAWQPGYGGQLELWNADGTRCEKAIEPFSVEPLFSRSTTAISMR